jgi:hypothetical protein
MSKNANQEKKEEGASPTYVGKAYKFVGQTYGYTGQSYNAVGPSYKAVGKTHYKKDIYERHLKDRLGSVRVRDF